MTTTKPPVLTDDEVTAIIDNEVGRNGAMGWGAHIRAACLAIEQAVLERAGADAVRYQWLRSQGIALEGHDFISFDEIADHRIDEAIRALKVTPAAASANEHIDDDAVDAFAVAMKDKLADARRKGRSRWFECDPADLSRMLRDHVEKGDPRDVANFCMFLWSLGKPITPAAAVADHVGESDFEQWFASYQPQSKGAKQQARDAYAAGMAGQLSGNAGEVDAKDAERYRWLRAVESSLETRDYAKGVYNGPSCYHMVGGVRELKWGSSLDVAIDAAIAASKGANHG